jgi:hypothetical protein
MVLETQTLWEDPFSDLIKAQLNQLTSLDRPRKLDHVTKTE